MKRLFVMGLLFMFMAVAPVVSLFAAEPEVATNSGAISSVTVAGLVEQNGTPTPTTPIDIVSNNGVLKVSSQLLTNGNCANNTDNWVLGYISYNNTDDYITFTNNTSNSAYFRCNTNNSRIANHTYAYLITGKTERESISWGSRNGVNGSYIQTTERTFGLIDTFPENGSGEPWVNLAPGRTFTLNKKSGFRMFDLTALGLDTVITTPEQAIDYFGTTYREPKEIYTDGEVETITDSANHTATVATLLGVGDYRDTQNINTGAITRNVGVKVLDGTENWRDQLASVNRRVILAMNDIVDNNTLPLIVSHGEWNISLSASSNYWRILQGKYISCSTSLATIDAFKQYLADQYAAGTPVIVIYPLETATTESVAGQTMTTAPVDNRTGGVTGMTITTLLSSGASVVTTIAANAIKIATTAYNAARFSPVVTDLNSAVATIREIVTKTINQTAAIASLQADKQTRPEDTCPAGKKCLLVETEENGVIVPHWFPIIEAPENTE